MFTSFVVHAEIGLALSPIAHVVVVVFVVAILHRIFLYGRYTLYTKDVCVVLVTSMYFSGTGSDSSFGMYSLTLGST